MTGHVRILGGVGCLDQSTWTVSYTETFRQVALSCRIRPGLLFT